MRAPRKYKELKRGENRNARERKPSGKFQVRFIANAVPSRCILKFASVYEVTTAVGACIVFRLRVINLFCSEIQQLFCGWCGYMKGGLPDRGPVLPILMLISSSRCWNDDSSAFSLAILESRGRAMAKWGSAPTPYRWQIEEHKERIKINCNFATLSSLIIVILQVIVHFQCKVIHIGFLPKSKDQKWLRSQ